MNRIYTVVWNRSRGGWVVASEHATRHAKRGSGGGAFRKRSPGVRCHVAACGRLSASPVRYIKPRCLALSLVLMAWVPAIPSIQAQSISISGGISPSPPPGEIAEWQVDGSLTIGPFANGQMIIADGATVTTRKDGTLGFSSGVTGTATVTGQTSLWEIKEFLVVGRSGTGILNVENDATVKGNTAYIGYLNGSSGLANVSGSNTRLELSGVLAVGQQAGSNGTLSLLAGGKVFNSDGHIGHQAGSKGSVTVSGVNSQWTNSGDLYVGHSGEGSLAISNVGRVTSTVGRIGRWEGAVGTVSVSGRDSAWVNSGSLHVGIFGTGELRVENGGKAESSGGYIGYAAGGKGVATISGTDSLWSAGLNLSVGEGGVGELNILDGGKVSNHDGVIGREEGASGVVNISGANSHWHGTGDYLNVGRSGEGTLNIENGGLANSRTGYVGYLPGASGTVAVRGNGSLLELETVLSIGYEGTGKLDIASGGRVFSPSSYMAYFGGATATVSGTGSLWQSDSDFTIGNYGAGTLAIADGGRVSTSGPAYIGRWPGASGTVDIVGKGSSLEAAQVTIGDFGSGSVTVSEGGTIKANAIGLGVGPSSAGLLNIGASAQNAATPAGVVETPKISFGVSQSKLVFNHTTSDYIFTPELTSEKTIHVVDHVAGTTLLTGDSSFFKGTTNLAGGKLVVADALGGSISVTGGTLVVDGTAGGQVAVQESGIVTGAGAVDGSVTVSNGGTLNGVQGQTLHVGGNLTLDSTSVVNVALGDPSTDALFDVAGDLDLAGTLNVSDQGAFGTGVYRLFNYAGSLLDQAMALGSLPAGVTADDLQIQTSVAQQVNLVASLPEPPPGDGGGGTPPGDGGGGTPPGDGGGDTPPGDGGGGTPPGDDVAPQPPSYDRGQPIFWQGGSGTWSIDDEHWTDVSRSLNLSYTSDPGFVVFQGPGGTVRVNASRGPIGVTGMQFAGSGYVVEGDPIVLQGNNGETMIRVGDGTRAGAVFNATITAPIQGESALVKSDHGTLTLLGNNSYAGGTRVDAGTLIGNTRSIRGDIAAAGTVVFTDTGHGHYGGTLSGTGRLVVDAPGTLVMTGDSSGFRGTVDVASGTLQVGLGGQGALGGSVTQVRRNAVLGGSGSVGAGVGSRVVVSDGGTLSPGNSIGTLTVDGDLVFEPGSRLEIEVDPHAGRSDRVVVTGNAILDGGSVMHIGEIGEYALRSTHMILSAEGTLSGAFDNVASHYAFLDPQLRYDYNAGTVELELTRNDRKFDEAPTTRHGLTHNQKATARGVESIGLAAGHPVYDTIARMPADAARIGASLDELSGEIHASIRTALLEDSHFVRDAANDRMRDAFAAAAAPAVWSQAYGSWGSSDGDGNAAALKRDVSGLLIGADRGIGGWRAGLMAGYSHSSMKAHERGATGKTDSYHVGAYAGTTWNSLALRTGFAYSRHNVDTRRSLAMTGLGDSLSARYDGDSFQVFGELGYDIDMGSSRLEPFLNVAHVRLHGSGHDEQGGPGALTGGSRGAAVSLATLGLRGEGRVSHGTVEATLRGELGWRHAMGDVVPETRHAFSAGEAFTVKGVPMARNSAVIEAGVDFKLGRNARLGISYAGQLSGSSRDHGVKAGLVVRF